MLISCWVCGMTTPVFFQPPTFPDQQDPMVPSTIQNEMPTAYQQLQEQRSTELDQLVQGCRTIKEKCTIIKNYLHTAHIYMHRSKLNSFLGFN